MDEIHDSDIQFTIPKNSRAKTISFASYLKKIIMIKKKIIEEIAQMEEEMKSGVMK